MEQMISTMSPAAIAQKGFSDFGKGEIQAVLDACSETISWGAWDNPVVPFSKTYHGKSGVAEFFKHWAALLPIAALNPMPSLKAATGFSAR